MRQSRILVRYFQADEFKRSSRKIIDTMVLIISLLLLLGSTAYFTELKLSICLKAVNFWMELEVGLNYLVGFITFQFRVCFIGTYLGMCFTLWTRN